MQIDGNLVVYMGSTPLWSSRTHNKGCQPFRHSGLCVRCTETITFASMMVQVNAPGLLKPMGVEDGKHGSPCR